MSRFNILRGCQVTSIVDLIIITLLLAYGRVLFRYNQGITCGNQTDPHNLREVGNSIHLMYPMANHD